ncbi:putative leucine-rich repeat-containing protein DDB_G0290503 [Maniola hyperantus]|uniref:putative leucine-rich repeat-containing protein DDB_G0290503 n=1 Tax=Aphantopus hyperantus TaxID=2795564 RepID=UPI003748AF7B
MQERLMVISLKVDDYIYKKKPISIQEADVYRREIEEFRNQCQDESYIQISFVSRGVCEVRWVWCRVTCVLLQAPPRVSLRAPLLERNNRRTRRATLRMSLNETFIIIIIMINPSPAHYRARVSSQNNIINYVETNVENNTNKSEINNVNDEKDKTLVDDSSEQSQNLLNNVNYSSAWALQNNTNYGKEIANNIAIITSNSNMNTGNKRTRLEEVLNLKAIKQKELGCDSNKLSQKILNHFDYGNHTVASVQPLYDKIPDNIIDARYNVINFNNANTGNSNTTSKFSYLNVIQQKEKELGGESNKLSQNLRNLENKTNVVVGILKNNTNVKNYQTQQIPETRYSNNNVKFSKSNQTQHSTFSDLNVIQLKEKELGGESNKLSQNLRNLENKTNEVVGIIKNNTNVKNYQTQQIPEIHGSNNVKFSESDQTQHNTFMPPKSYKVQDNTIFKSNIQNIIEPLEPPKKVQRKMANDSSQNQENAIGKVKRRRRKLNKDIVETTKKRTYNRKNKDNAVTARNDLSKEETVHSSVQDAKNPGNSVKNSIQEKQRTISKNKRDEMDISWVENMKFVRAITTDEYFKFDNLEESFWTDLSLPSDMSLTDFEYDNINIWKN